MGEMEERIAKHTVKDSIFTNLFGEKKYLIQLYQAIHPEDTETTEHELMDVTIKNILTDGLYNDLGFRVGDKILILVEAQSTWTMNIIVRILMYLAHTYHNYFEHEKMDLYSSKKVQIPKPELYVIYTGERTARPDFISLSEEFFHGQESAVEVKVKMLYGGKGNDIISQYVNFTKVYNEQLKQCGRTRKAIAETIRICKNKNVLKEYLEAREKEVVTIMMALFDEEQIMRNYVARKEREAVEKAVKKVTEETAIKTARETAIKTARETAIKMLRSGKFSAEEVAEYITNLSVDEIREIEKGLKQAHC